MIPLAAGLMLAPSFQASYLPFSLLQLLHLEQRVVRKRESLLFRIHASHSPPSRSPYLCWLPCFSSMHQSSSLWSGMAFPSNASEIN